MKIKEDRMQELKNFGYYKHDYSGNYQKNLEYAPIKGSTNIRTITKSIFITFFITLKDRCIYYCDGNSQTFATIDNPYIQDLIKADMVEKDGE